jgi:hypothetical protein
MALVALSLAFVACNKSNSAVATGQDSASAIDSVTPVSSGIRDYVVGAGDYAFRGLPLHAPAGWLTFRLANGGHETHMLSIASVPDRYTVAAFIDSLVRMKLPSGTKFWSGVDVVSPGDTGVVSVFLPAGRYVASCFVQSADGGRHVEKGMVGSFDVVASPDTGSNDYADAIVTLSNKHIRIAGPALRRGVRTIRVASSNAKPQDFQLLKLRPGRSARDALKWFTNRNIVAPAAEALGGVSEIHAGQKAAMTVDFTPGNYLLVFQLDGTDKRPKFAQLALTIPSR